MRSARNAVLAAIFTVVSIQSALPSPAAAELRVEAEVYEQLTASTDGRAYVVIATTPAILKAGQPLSTIQSANQATRNRILSTLAVGEFDAVYLWDNVSGMTGYVNFSGLQKLAAHPDVIAIGPDQAGHATLDSSVPYINGDNVHNAGITGRGITIAVLDTGIDTDHADLSDNLATGAWTFLDQGATQGAGAEDDNGHGTNVSGIITSKGVVSSLGVAPDADILAVKVLAADGGGWLSDWVSGVNYIVANAGNYTNLCAMNMSLGSNTLYAQCPCDNANATNIALKNALTNAINAGIASFASSGNDASTTSMGSPACITGATAVAAVYEGNLGREPNSGTYSSGCFDATTTTDQITCFSNRSGCNELAAPGRSVIAPGVGGGLSNFTGTSQAAPHVAGVAALMCQVADSLGNSLTPAQMVQTMKSTGSATFDPATTSPNPVLVNALGAVLGGTPAPVTLTSATPSAAMVGSTGDVLLLGSNFTGFFDVSFGADVTVNSRTASGDGDSLFVNITVDDFGTPGLRDIIVTDSFSADTLSSGFAVLATTRHYSSPVGSNVFPYITPATAATSISDAITAAVDGDSILVDSTTVNLVSLTINKSVIVYGGWTDNFANRDAANTRTTLSLSSNVSLISATGVAGIDGFLIKNGAGTLGSQPLNGNYGGAIKILLGSGRVSNCEIRNCSANSTNGFGGGGGIFATGVVVDIYNNWIHNNDATRGGGIYLLNSSGSVSNNTIENNTIATGDLQNPFGAGITLDQCSNVMLTGNILQANSGAVDGGAAWITSSSNTTWSGGSIANHSTTNSGGALRISSSDVEMDSVVISNNSTSLFGGGIWTDSELNLSQCQFLSNAAVLGGALYATTSSMHILHNLFISNATLSSGAAIYLSGVPSGEVLGNTLDRNLANAGAGGMLLSNSSVSVDNNIITNSGGAGISCSSGSPTFSYNLVWNSGTSDYDGCSAGTGAISMDPLYVDTLNVDYHLGVHSPAIDAGDPDALLVDLDGSPADMGWYGSHPTILQQPEFPKNLAASSSGSDVVLNWDPNPELDVDHYAVYCDSVSGFVPSATTFVGTAPDTTFTVGPATGDTLYYRVVAVNTTGYASGFSDEAVADQATSTSELAPPNRTALQQNYPNPFNPMTTIQFDLARPGPVTLVIFDMTGRRVRELVNATLPADRYQFLWDGRDQRGQRVASGIYHSRLHSVDGTFTRKMVLLK